MRSVKVEARADTLLGETARYAVKRRLGEGAFGAVDAAIDVETGQLVALKALTRAQPVALARFKQEFRVLAGLHHPNLVELREMFEHAGAWIICMEFVDGSDLLTWLRPAASRANGAAVFDEERLRTAFAGVAEGLRALHAHGVLHRDLKPSNVRVTPEGRAVLLDFGLVIALDAQGHGAQGDGAGTAAYMAPEQATGSKLGSEADWYAFGACLYEALTGVTPFAEETAFNAVLRKQRERPPAPSTLCPHVPGDLDALCSALLEPLPAQRPRESEILRVLNKGHPSAMLPGYIQSLAPEPAFEGRERELEELKAAFARTHEGELSIVLISGESGVGKSALVREMLAAQKKRDPNTWVLPGRCYEHEQVPYKAFDGCIDSLAKALTKLTPELCAAALPRRAGVVAQLFPVLNSVPSIARSSKEGAPAEPMARRLHAFALLGSLLGRLAERRPVILAIDDLQWADQESFRLLRALVEHREPPPVLIVGTVRLDQELEPELVKQIDIMRSWSCARSIVLHGLPTSEAQLLAQRLLGDRGPSARSRQIAIESMGNPLLVSELAQFANSDLAGSAEITQWSALSARISALPELARTLLERVALCTRPRSEVFFESLLGRGAGFGDVLKLLLAHKLVARKRAGHLTCFHDRVRSAVTSAISPERVPGMHADMARALEAEHCAEPSELAYHWDQAGEVKSAQSAYTRAAEAAMEILAFAQAAQFFGRALALKGDSTDVEGARLLIQRGHALARAGRSAEAAALYVQAAEQADGETRIRLWVSAAQHHLQGAQVEEGLSLARKVLSELGIGLPTGAAASLARITWERAKLRLRGLEVPETSTVSPQDELELDAMFQLAVPVNWVDMLPGSALNMRYLRRAFAVGERSHVARALGIEASFRAMQAPERSENYLPLLARSRDLASHSEDPALQAEIEWFASNVALFRGDFTHSEESLEAAHELLTVRCPGEPWLLTHVRTNLGSVCGLKGNYRRLARDVMGWIAEADERQDRFAPASLAGLGCGYLPSLMQDDPEAALALIARAMRVWPADPFTPAHHGELIAATHANLYAGGAAALTWLDQRAHEHDRAFLHRTRFLGASLHLQRAPALLCAGAEATPEKRRELLRRVDQALAKVNVSEPGWAGSVRLSMRGQLAVARGELEGAARHLEAARERFKANGMQGWSSALGYLQGVLEGEEVGREKRALAIRFFQEQGWKNPWRAITIYAPVVRWLETGPSETAHGPLLVHDRYQPLKALQSDGFDTLTQALDTRTGRTVTLRSLINAQAEDVSRLKREFRALQTLPHDNLVRLEALFEHEGTCTIAMEHIEGTDFLSHVRPNGVLDEARLRSALTGLLRGAGALHEGGFVHRDLNPTNVLVTPEGRVVLIDFGLMTPLEVSERDATEMSVGLLVYVAPEQLDRPDFDASADVYAIGASLYVALTGQLPFDHFSTDRLLDAKRRGRPIPPFALRIQVPTDLEELCLQMLEREPKRRPSVAASLARLERNRAVEVPALASTSLHPPAGHSEAPHEPGRGTTFTGRTRELSALDDAFAQAQMGEASLVLVQGESGLGKTALVGELLRRIKLRERDAWILRSRCYANEQIAYQAFDAVVDELARALRRLPRDECELLLPARAALLTQLFPVLGSVGAIGEATKKGLPAEPAARKRAALTAFVALIANVCARVPMVIAIDDLQWADTESFRLLDALLIDSRSRRPMLVATRRKGEARTESSERELEELSARQHTRVLDLTPLTDSEAEGLTVSLLGETVRPERVRALVQESGGHPLFLRELAAYASRSPATLLDGTLDLDHALAARFDSLQPDARKLLELVALAARPLPEHVFERAFGDGERYAEALRELLREELVRTRSGADLVCYHDRVREGVTRARAPELTRELSEQLARALDSEPASDAGERARLWEQAGRIIQACAAYGEAGDAALEILAFAQADALYERALDLKGNVEDRSRMRLLVQRGHARARMGKSADAAKLYLDASQLAEGDARMRLRLSATRQLLQSAQLAEGLSAARAILSELGTPLPETTAGALTQLVWDRAYLGLRGLAVKSGHSKVVSSEARLRLDAAWDLAFPVVWVDMVPAASLNAQHLRASLALGEPGHVARALAQEAAFLTMQRPTDLGRCRPLFKRARALFDAEREPKLAAFVDFIEGSAAQFRWDFSASRTLLERAESLCSEHCPDEPWLLTNARMALGSVWFNLGEQAKLATMSEAWIDEARGRSDSFALAALEGLGQGFERYLMRDDPDTSREELAKAMAPWPREPLSFAQFGEVFGVVNTELYRGGDGAKRWLDQEQARLGRAFLIRSKFGRATMDVMQTYAALCVCVDASQAQRAATLASAHKRAYATARHTVPIATMLAPLLVAQVLALEGKVEQALAALRPGRDELNARGIFYRYPALYLEGLLEAGDEGRSKRDTALAFFAGQGWKNPRRAVAMWVPAINELEAR